MACCEKRPYLCGVLVLGSIALFFHLVGFATPGWIILRRSVLEEEEFGLQRIDNGGVIPPHEGTTTDPLLRQRRSEDDSRHNSKEEGEEGDRRDHGGGDNHDGGDDNPHSNHRQKSHHGGQRPADHQNSHHGGQRPADMSFTEDRMMHEETRVHAWMMEITAVISVYDVRICYGLWYSKICVHDKTVGFDDIAETPNGHDSSSGGDGDDGHHEMGHYRCKKISTKLALFYSFLFDAGTYKPGNERNSPLSDKNFGYASLKENQVESCVVLAFLVLGLISAVVGFRKVNGGRCAATACIIFMLIAAFVALVPVVRLSHYNMSIAHQNGSVMVHPPYSVISTGVGALFALVTALVAGCALRMKTRRQSPGTWLQFNNELDQSNEKKETPSLGYYADPLPVKVGLYDVCNFEDITPVDEIKKPEEEPEDFIL